MPPVEKPKKTKPQTSKKRAVTAKKPNPRTPNIIKIKINNSRLKEPEKQPSPEPELITPKDCNLRNLNKEHSLLLANAVANMQLASNKPYLLNDAMVEIVTDQINSKKKKKRSLSLVKSPKVPANNKKPATKPKEPKMAKKRKASNKLEVVKDKKPKLYNQSTETKKKRGRKKTKPEGKQDTINKIFDSELLDQLKNFNNSSPLCAEKAVEDQKISRSSSVDDFLWAEEISTSNDTCLTGQVTPRPVKTKYDLVPIDGKLPILKLIDCRNMVEDETMMESPKPSLHSFDKSLSVSNSLSLSSSSSSEAELTEKERALEILMHKLTDRLNSLDIEFINWLDDGEDSDTVDLQSKTLNLEIEGIRECQMCIQRRLSTSSSESEKTKTPAMSPFRDADKSMTKIPEDLDEDAISLYAESFTGVESSRVSSVASFAPYKPRSKFCSYKEIETVVPKTKILCEKQNADSTVNKDEKGVSNPSLISSQYAPIAPTKSKIFSGVCFFNMAGTCWNKQCSFPHTDITPAVVSERLSVASEEVLFQDYMLLRNHPQLRNKFLPVFAMECGKRGLTRELLEIAFDSCKASPQIRKFVLEATLDNIQKIDLSICEDLLKRKDSGTKMRLSDMLMGAIADTWNLGHLVSVFVSLVNFIVKLSAKFQLCVAQKVLERICLLPYEEKLFQALILVIKNTDCVIFESDAIVKFEERLLECNKALYDELLEYKMLVVKVPTQAMLPEQHVAEKKRYTSPDTTNLEKLKIDGPIITRTINTNSTRTFLTDPTNRPTVTNNRPTVTTNRPIMSINRQNMTINRPNMSTNQPNVSTNRPNMSTNRQTSSSFDFKIPKHMAPRGQMRGQIRPNFGQNHIMGGQNWLQTHGNFRPRYPGIRRGGRGGTYQRRPRQDFFQN